MRSMLQSQENSSFQPFYHHSIDTCEVIFRNRLQNHYDKPINLDEAPLSFEETSKRPLIWERDVHEAARKGSVKSLQYNIYLLPMLRNLPDETGNTVVHLAAKNGEEKALFALKEMNCDFRIYNNNGYYPIHFVKTVPALDALLASGCTIEDTTQSGQRVIETQSNPFNKDVIEGLFQRGVNIFMPNQRGIYWMQYVIKNELYPDEKNRYVKFQKFVRKLLAKSPMFEGNSYLQHLLEGNVKDSEKDDAEFLRNAVITKDWNLFITYLAIGSHADTKNQSGLTNLMMISTTGEKEFAIHLANNYCDPNQCNNEGENCFWIAAWNGHFQLAEMYKKYYAANPNILSNSGLTIMHIAYDQHLTDLFMFLLNVGASPNVLNSKHETVQYISYKKCDDQVAEMIQDKYGGDINSQGKEGNTLGHLCIIEHNNDRLQYLISRKLNIEIRNDDGYSLFMMAIVCHDDLDLCQLLLENGANINTQDFYGLTPFYFVCKDDPFCKEEFDFLLNNNCDINIQTNSRDFPISQLIKRNLNDEALMLLDRKANIIDPLSPTEPVCIAIMKHSKFWLDILIQHGANAMNSKYSVIENYINTEFFDFETLKKLKPLNSAVGAPIQACFSKKYVDIAHYLWDLSNSQDRIAISASRDENGQIPLSVSIINNDSYLIEQLIHDGYDVKTPDKFNRTPFIYACIANNSYWMDSIDKLIDLNNLNVVDIDKNSAMSYCANNGRREFCDHLFIRGVNVEDINRDSDGIIQYYVDLLTSYRSIRQQAQDNKQCALHLLEMANNHVSRARSSVSLIKADISAQKSRKEAAQRNHASTASIDAKILSLNHKLSGAESHLREMKMKQSVAQSRYERYAEAFDTIDNASRETILYRLYSLRSLANYND